MEKKSDVSVRCFVGNFQYRVSQVHYKQMRCVALFVFKSRFVNIDDTSVVSVDDTGGQKLKR